MDAVVVELLEQRVQGRRLATAGRAGDQQQATRAAQHLLQLRELPGGQLQCRQRQDAALPVENAQDKIFAMQCRLAGHPEIHHPTEQTLAEMTVLCQAVFRNVHPRQYFQAPGQHRPERQVQQADGQQHAVDTVTNAQTGPLRRKVQIRSPLAHGICKQRRHQAHSGRFAVRLRHPRGLAATLIEQGIDIEPGWVMLTDGLLDLTRSGKQHFATHPARTNAVAKRPGMRIKGLRHGQQEGLRCCIHRQRQQILAARFFLCQ